MIPSCVARSKKARYTLPLADLQTSREQRFMCLADILTMPLHKVCYNGTSRVAQP